MFLYLSVRSSALLTDPFTLQLSVFVGHFCIFVSISLHFEGDRKVLKNTTMIPA